MKRFLFALTLLGLLFSCTREESDPSGGSSGGKTSLVETLEASEIEADRATLNAKLDLTDILYQNISFGFLWGTSESALEEDILCADILDKAFSASLEGLSRKTQYWYKAYVKLDGQTFYGEVKTFTTEEGLCPSGAVDLGLSVYWGTTNLGASNPEDYGDYYAWGETQTKSDYSWSTYKWGTSSSSLTKYNTDSYCGTVDNKIVLEPEDDVASKKLGGSWRIPTDAEWTELRTNCTWTWTSNYKGTGKAGRIVTSNKTGFTDKSIFLPAAGYRGGTSLYDAGTDGYYWSSSLNTDYPYDAWYVDFGSDNVSRRGSNRCDGQSVRPVTE
ncbi:MAG: hypothetical protein J6Y32_09020 [Bacteroidales bacterium]|nr:hypothetical protein [Bacteroidales bacterium]